MVQDTLSVLDQLVGHWRLTMVTTDTDGLATSSDQLRAEKTWFADAYVRETIHGVFASKRHEKVTLLAFNATRGRYEYVTADNHDTVLLLYASRPDAPGDGQTIDLYCDYVSPGDAASRGTLLTVRTRFEIDSRDRHRLTNFYTEPGGDERRFLEYCYERIMA